MGTEKRERQKANRQLKYQQQVKQQQRKKMTKRVVLSVAGVVGALVIVLLLAWFGGSGGDDDDNASDTTAAASTGSTPGTIAATTLPAFVYGTGPCPPPTLTEPVKTFADAPQQCIDPSATYTATFVTSQGDIVVDLDTAEVPGTVNNFVTLADYGYYDDSLIFRADPSIDIIQGGGQNNTDSPGYTIPDEANDFTYEAGQLVMARTQAPNSAGGQWFFVGGPNASSLDAQGTYVVFGNVTEGLDVVQKIIGLAGPDGQTPTEEVTVESIEITQS